MSTESASVSENSLKYSKKNIILVGGGVASRYRQRYIRYVKRNWKMEKNQNGEPRVRNEENTERRADCKGSVDMPLGYAVFPIQKFRLLYSASDALSHGTLFEELYLPMEVYNNGNKR